jgi:hypothetical protein
MRLTKIPLEVVNLVIHRININNFRNIIGGSTEMVIRWEIVSFNISLRL